MHCISKTILYKKLYSICTVFLYALVSQKTYVKSIFPIQISAFLSETGKPTVCDLLPTYMYIPTSKNAE